MDTVDEPSGRQSADPHGPVHPRACFHEAAHVLVDRAFGLPVAAVWVRGEEAMVEAPPAPAPDAPDELARHYWGRLCSTVAGDLGEFLLAEIEDTAGWGWRTPEERVERLEWDEAFPRAMTRGQPTSPPTAAPRFPAGQLGLMIRYAVMLTGRVLTVTGRLWWGIAGNGPADEGPGLPTDASKALELAGRLYSLRTAAVPPFGNEWPADVVDADGLFAEFHLIRSAEVEAERILKREWAGVQAVASSLYRRKTHRMTGKQVDALLRGRVHPPSTPGP